MLTTIARYDAEATIRKDGTIVFTSLRDGDLDIYTMDRNGKNVKRLTNELGYDGGPFWSYDGKQIVFRAHHPETEKEKSDYLALLKDDLIRCSRPTARRSSSAPTATRRNRAAPTSSSPIGSSRKGGLNVTSPSLHRRFTLTRKRRFQTNAFTASVV
jgi:Tol biopolymer transport system component